MIVSLRPLPQQCLLPTTPSRGVGAWGIHWGVGPTTSAETPGEGRQQLLRASAHFHFYKLNDFSPSLSAKSQPKQRPAWASGPRICPPAFLFSIHSVSDPRASYALLHRTTAPPCACAKSGFSPGLGGEAAGKLHCPQYFF